MFIDLRFKRWQVVGFTKARMQYFCVQERQTYSKQKRNNLNSVQGYHLLYELKRVSFLCCYRAYLLCRRPGFKASTCMFFFNLLLFSRYTAGGKIRPGKESATPLPTSQCHGSRWHFSKSAPCCSSEYGGQPYGGVAK